MTGAGNAAYGGVHRAEDLPATDLWDNLYGRRSIRKFTDDAVPREMLEKVLDAGLIAPTSCNLQMWDFVVVDDGDVLEEVGRESIQVLTAPVCIFVAYGREYSEGGYANVQSVAAAMQNMSLAAHALGLGSFWITQLGDVDRVQQILGIPMERELFAALSVGWPEVTPKRAPKRRPKDHVRHWNRYAGRPIPSSPDPEAWTIAELGAYQRVRVLNGNRYNKPRSWEKEAVLAAVDSLIGEDAGARWLDFMPFSGVLTETVSQRWRSADCSTCDLTAETAGFAARRSFQEGEALVWDPQAEGGGLPAAAFDTVACLFRLEGLPAETRSRVLRDLHGSLRPGGRLLLGWCNARSYQAIMSRLRKGRMGGVEYVVAPEPHLGPFQPLGRSAVMRLVREAGFRVVAGTSRGVLPGSDEASFRSRNLGRSARAIARAVAALSPVAEAVPGLARLFGRLQFLCLEKPS